MTSLRHPVESKAESAWHTGLDWAALTAARPVFWGQRGSLNGIDDTALPPGGLEAASARLDRMAPLLARLFPHELGEAEGRVESPLQPAPALQAALGLAADTGSLFVKADHVLPVAGSVKARGGFHEVLEHAEALALRHGLPAADPGLLACDAARALFATHQVAVGSTGNLGLAIGIMAAALGFEAVVHMSADAKDWKKERLRRRGVRVVEHAGDYAQAVAAGRAAAVADPRVHFVDDERSASLFLGYAVAAERLAAQLAATGRVVDAAHPLIVHLPCGVGGAPGGIAWGLARTFGEHVHCFFAEPVRSPCFLLQLLAMHPAARGTNTVLAALAAAQDEGTPPSVYDIGLDNRTEADGLAVPRASALAGALAGPRLAGAYTVTDDDLHRLLHHAAAAEALRLEPSAAAGLAGPGLLTRSAAGRAWLRRQGLEGRLAGATQVAWTTGGQAVPDDEIARFRARGAALAATPADDPALRAP